MTSHWGEYILINTHRFLIWDCVKLKLGSQLNCDRFCDEHCAKFNLISLSKKKLFTKYGIGVIALSLALESKSPAAFDMTNVNLYRKNTFVLLHWTAFVCLFSVSLQNICTTFCSLTFFNAKLINLTFSKAHFCSFAIRLWGYTYTQQLGSNDTSYSSIDRWPTQCIIIYAVFNFLAK